MAMKRMQLYRGMIGAKTFYWLDALPAAKPPMEMTHYQHACGQCGG